MPPLTEQAHAIIRLAIQEGGTAIDATAGNGHDTVFLARWVGSSGKVFAFDVQQSALDRTAERLLAAGLTNATLLRRDHAELRASIQVEHHGRIAAVMFNLGYLPGGDMTVTTNASRTVEAIVAALEMLRPQGILTVIAYVGHTGGLEEAATVEQLLRGLNPAEFTPQLPETNSKAIYAPRLYVVTKR